MSPAFRASRCAKIAHHCHKALAPRFWANWARRATSCRFRPALERCEDRSHPNDFFGLGATPLLGTGLSAMMMPLDRAHLFGQQSAVTVSSPARRRALWFQCDRRILRLP